MLSKDSMAVPPPSAESNGSLRGEAGAERVCVVFNPTARGDKAVRFRRFLEGLRGAVELCPTTGPGAARPLAREAVESGFGRVIAAGGDGTAFEVLNGIADVPGGFERTALGVLPLGTANVLAHELGMPMGLESAWAALQTGVSRWVDGAEAEFHDGDRRSLRCRFAVVAGAGLDARAVQQVSWRWKRRVGKLAYVAAALRAWQRYPDRVRMEGRPAGRPFEGRVVVVGNGRLYAGNIPVFEGGRLDSGRLRVLTVARVTPRVLWGCATAYLTRRWPASVFGHAAEVDEVRLLGAGSDPVPLQLDGEFVGWLPATLRVIPASVRLIHPAPTDSG